MLAWGEGSVGKTIARSLIYVVLFLIAMEIAVDLFRGTQAVTPLWLAGAVAAWALVTAPIADWLLITLLLAAAHIARGLILHDTPAMEAIYLAANVGSPLACAALLRRFTNGLAFEDRNAIHRFLLIGGIAAPAVSTFCVYVGSFIEPSRFKIEDLPVWFLADALSYLVFLPIFKSLASGDWRELFAVRLRTRTIIFLPALVAVLVIGLMLPPDLYSFYTIFLPAVLIYLAFELGVAGARAAIALSALAILGHVLLRPISAVGLVGSELALASQLYIAALVICVLPLAEALAEKQRLYEQASDALSEAQAAWGDLIAAEAHYRLVADNTADMILRLDLDGAILFASPACHALASEVETLTGQRLADLAEGDDAAHIRDALAGFAAAGAPDQPHSIRARLATANGDRRQFEIHVTLVAARRDEPGEFIAVLRPAA